MIHLNSSSFPFSRMVLSNLKEKRTEIRSGFSGTQKGSGTRKPLPDDLVMEILSWLPVNCVLKFQSVCSRWKALILTPYFKQMHLMKTCSPPMILCGSTDKKIPYGSWYPPMILLEKSGLLQLDKSVAAPKEEIAMRKVWPNLPSSFAFHLSYHGLIVISEKNPCKYHHLDYTILNPISPRGKVTISHVHGYEFELCGMFFNTFIKEYCVLWGSFNRGRPKFKLLTLGPKPCFRDLKQPTFLMHQPRFLPVVIDDDATIYWLLRPLCMYDHDFLGDFCSCERQILAFDIKTEEFTLMPHPGPRDHQYCPRGGDSNYDGLAHMNTQIVKMGGRLSYVQMTINMPVIINIWTLKDSASRLWVKTHSGAIFNADLISRSWPVKFESFLMEVIGNGELWLHFRSPYQKTFRGIYAYNLARRTIRRIDWRTYDHIHTIPMYVPSLISLRNHKILFPVEDRRRVCYKCNSRGFQFS